MRRTPAAIAVFCTVLAVGCTGSTAKKAPLDPRVTKLFGGQESVQNIAEPKTVQAFRIGDGVFQTNKPPYAFWGYPVIAGPIDVSRADRELLAAILLDARRYEWDSGDKCKFQPGVAFRFTANGSPTEVIYCFTCDDLMVVRDGKKIGYQLTGGMRGPLLALVKRLMPNDAKIQRIKVTD